MHRGKSSNATIERCYEGAVSDIGILNGPMALAFMALLFGGPGIPIGAIIGALL